MSRFLPLVMLIGSAWISAPVSAQTDTTSTDSGWWKGLFRPTDEVPAAAPQESVGTPTAEPAAEIQSDTPSALEDTLALPILRSAQPATFSWSLPEGLATLDSLDKADPKPLQGYRIQIYFGDLQEARAVRAAFRRDHPGEACQLMPIAPNYAVTVGNYRDMWSAQRALRDGHVGSWKHALVIPSAIDLPALR
ncbi:MAG: hypothetical protein CMC99_03745 [Flavobacteriales bacterium]|nr:hypothetical protein [Flavobacteriales bacterium]